MPVQNTLAYLRRCCNAALEQLYPAGAPPKVMWRYHHEMRLLERAQEDVVDSFLLFKEISDAAQKMFSKIYVYGAIQGAMLVYLLGDHDLNPMPAHYYCTSCGYYEEPHSVTVGLDLPLADCPHCGKPLRRDGFTLRQRFVDGQFDLGISDYGLSKIFYPIAFDVARKHYRRYGVEAVHYAEHRETSSRYFKSGIALLPHGTTLAGIPESYKITDSDGDICVKEEYGVDCERFRYIMFADLEFLDVIEHYQKNWGIMFSEFPIIGTAKTIIDKLIATKVPTTEERRILKELEPVAFVDIMNCLAAADSLYEQRGFENTPYNNQNFAFMLDDDNFIWHFMDCPIYTGEDAYEKLLSFRWKRSIAYKAARRLRQGRWKTVSEQLRKSLPVSFEWLTSHTLFLSSRPRSRWLGQQYFRMAQILGTEALAAFPLGAEKDRLEWYPQEIIRQDG